MVIETGKQLKAQSGIPEVSFSDGSRPERVQVRAVSKDGIALTAVDLPRSSLAPLDSPDGAITIRFRDAVNYRFAPGGMKSAWKALAKCERDLLKSWGMSEAEQDRLQRMPVGRPGWIRPDDYPQSLVMRDIQGSVGTVLKVGADGRVSDCRAAEPSGTELLDKRTCDLLLKRAQFEPALDHDGKPMPALVFYRVTWLLQ
ncbi:energy transducer TonB [Sphingomonas mesophila]|uniref:energy transducer TonB n=1 Tax=Sphingomonas mesophila TaxID=2303576 RepID=UPI0013C37939|nr:energy transducer TonB [Sphingomonas mesophila]